MKTDVYNLIILDESGSMDCVRKQTISGCNETINTIKSSQKAFGETQNHYVSIYAFQNGGDVPSRYIVKNVPAAAAEHISAKEYCPYGNTPLYDAVGSTLVDLKATVKARDMAIGSVTIITDGMENASRQYTRSQVARMIEGLKEMGWQFSFIGANIDVKATASAIRIDNTLEFQQDEEGMHEMFVRESHARMAYGSRVDRAVRACRMSPDMSESERSAKFAEASEGYFNEDND